VKIETSAIPKRPWNSDPDEEQFSVNEAASIDEGRKAYWQSYYLRRSREKVLPLPSQFCVFVAGELEGPFRVLDIGCGSGRDSMLFASHGHSVTGVDGAAAAVDACVDLAERLGLDASFVRSTVDDESLATRLQHKADDPPRTLVYARFFLHAITIAEEGQFLELAAKITRPGDVLAVEFRTDRDIAQSKVTDAHYRRFIDPLQFMTRVLASGFTAHYFVEGFGFAKYKNDDAHVARFIFGRT
jgi:SAM-dependent methyltransferase